MKAKEKVSNSEPEVSNQRHAKKFGDDPKAIRQNLDEVDVVDGEM